MIDHLSKVEFEDKVIKSDKVALVDFFATWCGPCQMLAPVLEKIAEERKDFNIYKIDIDEEMELAIKYSVEVVPTMIIFKNGNPVGRLEGFHDKSSLIEEVSKYL